MQELDIIKFIKKFTYKDVEYEIVFIPLTGVLNGYINIKLFNIPDKNVYDIPLHGGVTFFSNDIIGFDCNHISDLRLVINKKTKKYLLNNLFLCNLLAFSTNSFSSLFCKSLEFSIPHFWHPWPRICASGVCQKDPCIGHIICILVL